MVTDIARYLGPVITPLQLSSPEIERRIAAASAGFYSMGAFWSMNVPRQWKRVIFIGLVQGSLLTGLEPYILTYKQHNLLDRHLARLGRTAM
eukprot:9487076-Pyramimonas_sp.AAC.1